MEEYGVLGREENVAVEWRGELGKKARIDGWEVGNWGCTPYIDE